MKFAQAPAHIRAAIRAAADRWETPQGIPLLALLKEDDPEDQDGGDK